MSDLFVTGEAELVIRRAMRAYGLTARQEEVCWRYVNGRTYQQMADEFGCSVQTIKRHMVEIKYRCGFEPGLNAANPVRMLRLLCGLAPSVPLVAA